MKAIIAAGGTGSRLYPLTFSSNKHMLPVANKPLLLYPFEAIVETGVKEIGLIVNQTRPAIENLLGDGSKWGVKVEYIEQPEALGLAHVVKISKGFLDGSPFIYHLGDNIFSEGIMRPFKHFEETQPDGLLTMVKHEENYRMGVPFFDEEGNLLKVVEKPENPPNPFGVPGLYFFSPKVFEAFEGEDQIQPSARGELEITDLYTYLLEHGYRVETEEVDGRWMDPGKFDDMLDANAFMLHRMKGEVAGEVDEQSSLEGEVVIEEGARVENSKLFGPVHIAKGTLISNSIIGPDVSIAENCKLENMTVRESVIMQDTTMFDVKKPVVNSLVGKNTEVWENKQDTVSLFIGDHCKVRLT